MTDKEKQIEEMAKVLHDRIVNQTWRADKVAKELYEIVVPKGSVVLSKEEYLNDFNNQFNKGYKHGSEETAREVLEAIKFFIEERNNSAGEDLEDVMIDGLIFTEVLDELAKQFGVEVEE